MARPDRTRVLRDELDRRLGVWRRAGLEAPPPEGWVRALRTALGLTTRDLADRLGVSQSRIPALERAEVDRTLQLDTLERAAAALGCRLMYALVPDRPLDELAAPPRPRLTDADIDQLERHLAGLDRPLTHAEVLALLRTVAGRDPAGSRSDHPQVITPRKQHPEVITGRSPTRDHATEATPTGDHRAITHT